MADFGGDGCWIEELVLLMTEEGDFGFTEEGDFGRSEEGAFGLMEEGELPDGT